MTNRSGPENPGGALERALQALTAAVREEVARHPQSNLLQLPRTAIDLTLPIPLAGDEQLEERLDKLRQALGGEIDSLVAHRSAFRFGRVLNLRTQRSDGTDTRPPDNRFVFGGYSPSGVPRFFDFGQWLLHSQHPHIDRIYLKPPRLVTAISSQEDLYRELLPAFRDNPTDYTIHGQVAAGWFFFPRANGDREPLALTFQVLSSQRGKIRRFGLNILGQGSDGETLEVIGDQLGQVPWKPATDWANKALDSIERGQKPGASTDAMEERIRGVLGGIARRLDQARRARERRTGHAEKRHQRGDRPTHMALRDLTSADVERVLHDRRHETWIVLGSRGRAHVWSPEGKLVTSIHHSPESIERKKKHEIWRPATSQEVDGLKRAVAQSEAAED